METKPFIPHLLRTAAPIMLQYLFNNLSSIVTTLLTGQLGDASLAAVGLANQVFFVLSVILFGVGSGCAVFGSQYFGSRDLHSVHKVMGISLTLTLSIASLVFALSIFVPQSLLSLYTNDPEVIRLGAEYLRLLAPSFLFTAVVYSFSSTLRSTGETRLPMIASVVGLLANLSLSSVLMFGRFGFPVLGMRGAAIALGSARVVETVLIVVFTYRLRLPAAAKLREYFGFSMTFLKRVLGRAMAVTANELVWVLGVTTFNAIYAHISTTSIAAFSIMQTVESIAFAFIMGISIATGILVGQHIGAGGEQEVLEHARKALRLAVILALILGALIATLGVASVNFYKVSAEVADTARVMLLVLASAFLIRVINTFIILGFLRAGGDTTFSAVVDSGTMWLVGVPLAAVGAFILHLPAYMVYMMALSDEVVKLIFTYRRYRSGRWVNNLVRPPSEAELEVIRI